MSGYLETGLECGRARLAYFLTAAYSPSITKQSYLIFSQKRNIFYTRQAWVKMKDESVKAPLGSDFIQTYPYSISLGMRLNL
ncbi:hypothetical protein DSL64_28355 [Dyadobacter luteus]|uniref:Uncharacterized protein n=1 Tax=Dyadobacter luteus TaxID=2259619 RepID=A0A3D8Y2C1_9BACT|nr:hypothetical protein [Dyadobacter luteus]REA55276.1 hypothetical protein DSL64_28355 [Dyadobacter luteus]